MRNLTNQERNKYNEIVSNIRSTAKNTKYESEANSIISGTMGENIDFLSDNKHSECEDIYKGIISECSTALAFLQGKSFNEDNLWVGLSELNS